MNAIYFAFPISLKILNNKLSQELFNKYCLKKFIMNHVNIEIYARTKLLKCTVSLCIHPGRILETF